MYSCKHSPILQTCIPENSFKAVSKVLSRRITGVSGGRGGFISGM